MQRECRKSTLQREMHGIALASFARIALQARFNSICLCILWTIKENLHKFLCWYFADWFASKTILPIKVLFFNWNCGKCLRCYMQQKRITGESNCIKICSACGTTLVKRKYDKQMNNSVPKERDVNFMMFRVYTCYQVTQNQSRQAKRRWDLTDRKECKMWRDVVYIGNRKNNKGRGSIADTR